MHNQRRKKILCYKIKTLHKINSNTYTTYLLSQKQTHYLTAPSKGLEKKKTRRKFTRLSCAPNEHPQKTRATLVSFRRKSEKQAKRSARARLRENETEYAEGEEDVPPRHAS